MCCLLCVSFCSVVIVGCAGCAKSVLCDHANSLVFVCSCLFVCLLVLCWTRVRQLY
eukprot:m.52590 g.52590  ORF g.52590 m.52590 type:complete len:56 (+) comp11783_c0_seq2:69-236(+)